MPTVLRSKFSTILLAVQARLVAKLGFPLERVLVSKKDPPFFAQGDQFVVVRPRGFRVSEPIVGAAGRVDTRIMRRFTVTLWTRLVLDETDRDTEWLTDPTLGHLDQENAVIDAVQIFWPATSGDDLLTTYPIRLVDGSEPGELPSAKEWGASTLTFEAQYEISLDQSEQ